MLCPIPCSKPVDIEKRAPGYPRSVYQEHPVIQRQNPTSQFSVRLLHKPLRAQEQYGLGTGTTPEDARPFQAQVDDAAHGTFDGAAPDRQLHGHQLRIGHMTLILDEIVEMSADRLAIA